MANCLSEVLKNKTVITKAPGRVDLGGGIDHRIISLLCQHEKLATFNIAIQLYTQIILEPHKKGYIYINSESIGQKEILSSESNFNDKFGLVAAIANFFQVDGVKINIKTQFPPMSGLGGSGSLAVALIGAFVKALSLENKYSKKDIVWLAHSIEDSLFKNTGLQDQAAACFGGINLWQWQYPQHRQIFKQIPQASSKFNFENHSLVVYSGCPHYLTRKGSKIIYSFFNQKESLNFVHQVNKNTSRFIKSLHQNNLQSMIKSLDSEEILRSQFLKYKIPSKSQKIINLARKNNCGVKFIGGGGGGCLWILGQQSDIKKLQKNLKTIKGIFELPFKIDYLGLV